MLWAQLGLVSLTVTILLDTILYFHPITNGDLGPIPLFFHVFDLISKTTISMFLGLNFAAPFCMSFVYGGQSLEVQPCLIGIEGTMPIDKLERNGIQNCRRA